MCFFKKEIPNKKYQKNKKNGGKIPAIPDSRLKYIYTHCGECLACRKRIQSEWKARLMEDIKEHTNGLFIGLTFNNKSIMQIFGQSIKKLDTTYEKKRKRGHRKRYKDIPIKTLDGYNVDNAIAKYAVRHFLERWRKEHGKSLRHWFITELGHEGTQNIHLHGFIWTQKNHEKLERIWKYGFVWDGYKINDIWENYVNEKTINYVTKYVTKVDTDHPGYKSKILCSPGIGASYITSGRYLVNEFNLTNTIETYRTDSGHKIALPTYWRNKIYNEDDKEYLWITKLNQEHTYIMGEKIQKEEENAMRHYWQQKSIEAGYGTGNHDEESLKNENALRNTLTQSRIENYNNKKDWEEAPF